MTLLLRHTVNGRRVHGTGGGMFLRGFRDCPRPPQPDMVVRYLEVPLKLDHLARPTDHGR